MSSVRALRLKVPSWLETEGNGQRLLRPLMDDARLKMEYYRSQMKYLESKYKTTFSRFEKRVNSTMRKENTEEWWIRISSTQLWEQR
jgi:hypothetical protein